MTITAQLTKDEMALLLYLETCAVDHACRVHAQRINAEDRAIIEKWVDAEFVFFGRIIAEDCNRDGSLWVRLSEGAWRSAHVGRKELAERMWKSREYVTTDEKRARTVIALGEDATV